MVIIAPFDDPNNVWREEKCVTAVEIYGTNVTDSPSGCAMKNAAINKDSVLSWIWDPFLDVIGDLRISDKISNKKGIRGIKMSSN